MDANDDADVSPSSVIAAAQQLQQAISGFAHEFGSSNERLTDLLKNSGEQSTEGAADAHGANADAISSNAGPLAQQLREAISRFAEGIGGTHEKVNAIVNGIDDQLSKVKAGLERNKERIETVANHVSNNRY